jgi:hypothetical protein
MQYPDLTLFFVSGILVSIGALIHLGLGLGYEEQLKKIPFFTVILLIVGAAGLYRLFNRNSYLPFLGKAVMPHTVFFPVTPSGATFTVKVDVDPKAPKVVYWASREGEEVSSNPWVAYAGYQNAGVVLVKDGVAELPLKYPREYRVGLVSRKLRRHVHYREIFEDGFVGKVKTKFIEI